MSEEMLMDETNLKDEIQKELQKVRSLRPATYELNNIHSYPAKMLLNIPSIIIPKFTESGETILDPFCGSGTVLLEAKINLRKAIGIDINPLAILISRVKTRTLSTKKIEAIKRRILLSAFKSAKHPTSKIKIPNAPGMNFWFTKSAKKQLGAIYNEISKIHDRKYRDYFFVCFSSCIRYASRADPDILPPVISKKMKEYLPRKRTNVLKYFKKVVDSNTKKIELLSKEKNNIKISAHVGDARKLSIKANTIDLVLTSPPYISAQKYPRSLKLELFWTGLTDTQKFADLDKHTIGTERVSKIKPIIDITNESKLLNTFLNKIRKKNFQRFVITKKYFSDMSVVIAEIKRVLKPDHYFVLLIGENTVCGIKAPTAKVLTEFCIDEGFQFVSEIEDQIRTFGFMTRRNKTAGLIDKEKLLIFKKGVASEKSI